MDFVPGTDLQELLPSLTTAEKTTFSERIKETINELRTIPPPDNLGNLNGTPYIDGVLSTPDNNRIISGPFKDQEQMNNGILERLSQTQSPHYIRLLREMVNRTLKSHRTVFTHGDLQPKNIVVERAGTDFNLLLLTGICHAGTLSFGNFAIQHCTVK
ncbi:unnamed protein product [Penicillium egyptiacum]|uniref:Aminoglycoside phosphotransferase domain-containing protein n=1 Tax=Penicillium egyptiacum TaxID=1303716 RepID=A0A9W4K706_9EURO|nr:unnamed protein product [Penicillium egyptiacum]